MVWTGSCIHASCLWAQFLFSAALMSMVLAFRNSRLALVLGAGSYIHTRWYGCTVPFPEAPPLEQLRT